jgi:hypothetical protein
MQINSSFCDKVLSSLCKPQTCDWIYLGVSTEGNKLQTRRTEEIYVPMCRMWVRVFFSMTRGQSNEPHTKAIEADGLYGVVRCPGWTFF